jgi:N-acetylmuramoyl-L-alanine amidase CwlA
MTKLLATDRILATRPGDPTTILSKLDTPDDLDKTYVRAMKTWCAAAGIDPFIALTQWAVETANGTSVRWVRDHNPGGVGIPADSTVQPFEIANGDEAARIHVQALYSTVAKRLHPDVPVPVPAQPWFDGVWLPKVQHPNYPGVTVVDDLNTRYTANGDAHATWAWDAEYITTLINRCALFYPDLQPQGGATVATYSVAGLSKKIELPVPLIVDLIDTDQTNQRPGIARQTPGYWVQHETANYAAGAGAKTHNDWLHRGADGSQLSFHFVVDDGVIYQMIPIDEVTWQSADGNGPGNMSGISCELCVNSGIDTAKARHNAEALAGGIFKVLGLGADRVKRHWDFNAADPNRHHCPDEMMNDNYWATFVNNVGVIASGKGGDNTTSYAPPITYPWLAGNVPVAVQMINKTKVYPIGNLYTVKNPTPRKQATGNNKQETGPPLKQGETFSARYAYRSGDKTYLLTDYGTRVTASDCLPRVQISGGGVVSVRYE